MGRLMNLIKMAFVSGTTDDTEPYPRAQVSFSDKSKDVIRYSPYGLCSVPPEGSLGLCLSSSAQESTVFMLADDYQNRFKGLKPGEVKVGNYSQESFIYFKEDGSILSVGSKVYLGTDSVSVIKKLRDALENIATVATYPTAVGPSGTMVDPSVLLGIIAELDSIDAGTP